MGGRAIECVRHRAADKKAKQFAKTIMSFSVAHKCGRCSFMRLASGLAAWRQRIWAVCWYWSRSEASPGTDFVVCTALMRGISHLLFFFFWYNCEKEKKCLSQAEDKHKHISRANRNNPGPVQSAVAHAHVKTQSACHSRWCCQALCLAAPEN